ncbi:Tetracycline resistance protein, class C [Alphaproteobacteria bacterium SO-S41]|nr:Tetracycline resistance protein, class C [Alphaproteobacteria bacterium SO-S41]
MEARAAKQAFTFIFLTRLLDSIGFGLIMPVLPSLLTEVGHITLAEATRTGGILFLTYAALQFLFGPLMGALSDQFGRRPIILLSLLAFAVDYTMMAWAPTLMWLFIGRAIAGVAGAVYAPANAYAADITPPDQRSKMFGRLGAAFGLGFIIGPALGGLVGELGPRAPFVLAAVLSAANLVFGYFVLPESHPPERRRKVAWKRANPLGGLLALGRYGGVLGIILAYFTFSLAFNVYPGTWAYYTEAKFGWSSSMIGLSLMGSGVFMALVQFLLTGPIIKKLGEANTAKLGMTVSILGCVAYAFMPYAWMVFAIQPFVAFQGLVFPTLNGLISQRVSPTEQGALQGVMGSMTALGSVFGPLALTQTLAYFTDANAPVYFPGAAFLLAGFLMSIALLMLFAELARQRRKAI